MTTRAPPSPWPKDFSSSRPTQGRPRQSAALCHAMPAKGLRFSRVAIVLGIFRLSKHSAQISTLKFDAQGGFLFRRDLRLRVGLELPANPYVGARTTDLCSAPSAAAPCAGSSRSEPLRCSFAGQAGPQKRGEPSKDSPTATDTQKCKKQTASTGLRPERSLAAPSASPPPHESDLQFRGYDTLCTKVPNMQMSMEQTR